ncbi:MAG: ASCH domain-containing protein [Mesorhizobium sp.]|nr:MAG: ASCH domain-containing protein [Mesorhizobium sp.]
MKVISIWQPWASLIVHGMKFFETRTWPAPRSIIGQTIGIAATKNIIGPQRDAYADPEFQFFYEQSGLPELDELPRGMLLGTVTLDSVEQVTQDFVEDVTREELAFGWYELGGYAWRLRHAKTLVNPIPVSGKQGIWDYRGFDVRPSATEIAEALQGREGEGHGPAGLRRDLHAI